MGWMDKLCPASWLGKGLLGVLTLGLPALLWAQEPRVWTQGQAAPGQWSFEPTRLISGQSTRLELRYRHGAVELPPGASYSFQLEGFSVKSLPFTPISTELELIEPQGQTPVKVDVEAGPVNGLGCRAVKLSFPLGVPAGGSFALCIGNRGEDGQITAIIYPVPVHPLAFDIKADLTGQGPQVDWFEMGWWEAMPRADIEAGPATALRMFGPTLVAAGQPFDLRVAVTDAFDSGAWPTFEGNITLLTNRAIDGLPAHVAFTAADDNARTVAGLMIATPGVYRVAAVGPEGKTIFESNPIIVREQVEEPIQWGLLHGHNQYSECWGDGPRAYYRFGRDIAGLDFLALSDHMGHLPIPQGEGNYAGRLYAARFGRKIFSHDAWLDTIAAADEYYQPGRFCTLAGYEWSSEQSGHHNVYLADLTAANYAQLFTQQYVDVAYEMRNLLSQTEALFIPHAHAWYFPYMELEIGRTRSGQPLSPVFEAYSDWGMSFHPFAEPDQGLLGKLNTDAPEAMCFRQGVDQGLELGLIADSDTHTGWPARRFPAGISPEHGRPQGITAVRMADLTRGGLVQAYRQRKTYGTSGEHIFLEMTANGVTMGETLRTDGPVQVRVQVAGTAPLTSVALYDGQRLIEKQTPPSGARDGVFMFSLPAPGPRRTPYFVEVIQRNLHRAWSSPLWIEPASLADLAWEKDAAGGLWLVNRGSALAKDVTVFHDARQYPAVRPAQAAKAQGTGTEGGLLWTRRWNDRKLTVHWRWAGPPLAGRVTVLGAKSYRVDRSIRMLWFSTLQDDGQGTITFDGHKGTFDRSIRPGPPMHEGFDVTLEPLGDEPCTLTYEFEREVAVWRGEQKEMLTCVQVPVNGLEQAGAGQWLSVGTLEAGGRWPAPDAEGIWCADPRGKLDESDLGNNVFGLEK